MSIFDTLKIAWKHFKRILVHKYWVLYYCHKAGITWQGIVHDMSKFSWTEFSEAVKYYDPYRSLIAIAKELNGYSEAWQHHKGRNKHHHVYWTDNYDEGTTAIKMPTKYAVELICDYFGAARAYWGERFSFKYEWHWWLKNRKNLKMHESTKRFVDYILFLCSEFDGTSPLEDAMFIADELEDLFSDAPIPDERYDNNSLLISIESFRGGKRYG